MFVHEDDRRKIIEWASGEFKIAKVLIAKHGCVVGEHYHRFKDERFMLLSGKATHVVIGQVEWHDCLPPMCWDVPRGQYHVFELEVESILLGVGTEPFDHDDEIKGYP